MDLMQKALHEKLENITVEKLRWKKYEDDYKSAEVNLSSFRESLQKEILVPIGSKALMPGHLYHTNEILVGMYSGLLTKCSSYKAIELCNHRLRKAKEHIHALDAEHKMYKDRIDLPSSGGVFGNDENAREIIEDYDEDADKKWRKEHRQRVHDEKQREAAERRAKQSTEMADQKTNEDILAMLEHAELLEELENEMEQLNIDDELEMQKYIMEMEKGIDECAPKESSSSANLVEMTELISDCDIVKDNDDEILSDIEDDDDSDFSDEIAPEEFIEINKSIENLKIDEKLKVYQKRLNEVGEFLKTHTVTKYEELTELANKRALQECLRNAIDEIGEEQSASKRNSKENETKQKFDKNSSAITSSITTNPTTASPASNENHKKCMTLNDFKELEKEYSKRSKTVAIVFYKSQLRSVMKSIASCSKGGNIEHIEEKRKLYEYISDAIDQLRAVILMENHAKLEERFVDDETDNEMCEKYDFVDSIADEDECSDKNLSENENSIELEISSTVSGTELNESTASSTTSSTKRRICFATKPTITTYHSDDEPWRVQSFGELDETGHNLMDKTFEFFDEDNESDECQIDRFDDKKSNQNHLQLHETIQQSIKSNTIYNKDNSTHVLKFVPTNVVARTPSPSNSLEIVSPADVVKLFQISNQPKHKVDSISKQTNSPNNPPNQHISRENSVTEPKSILKNREAVQQEVHVPIEDEINASNEPLVQTFYTQENRCNSFDGFNHVVGDILERPQSPQKNNKNKFNGKTVTNGPNIKTNSQRVSLFKMNRMQ